MVSSPGCGETLPSASLKDSFQMVQNGRNQPTVVLEGMRCLRKHIRNGADSCREGRLSQRRGPKCPTFRANSVIFSNDRQLTKRPPDLAARPLMLGASAVAEAFSHARIGRSPASAPRRGVPRDRELKAHDRARGPVPARRVPQQVSGEGEGQISGGQDDVRPVHPVITHYVPCEQRRDGEHLVDLQ